MNKFQDIDAKDTLNWTKRANRKTVSVNGGDVALVYLQLYTLSVAQVFQFRHLRQSP